MRSLRPIIASLAVAAAAGASLTPAMSASAAGQAGAQQATQYQVTLKASAKEAVAKEDTIKLTGTVIPKPPEDSKVVVQVKYEGLKSWKKVGTATVKPNGNYRFDVEPESHLDRSYRVVKKTDDKAEGDTSREREIVVTAWSWLSSLVPSAGMNVVKADKMPINGDVYGHMLYSPMPYSKSFTEFTLGRQLLPSSRRRSGCRTVPRPAARPRCSCRRTACWPTAVPSTWASPTRSTWTSPTCSGSASTSPRTTPRRTPSRRIGAGRVLCD